MISTLMDMHLPSGAVVNPAETSAGNTLVLLFRKAKTPRRNVDLFDWRVNGRRKARIDDLMLNHVTASAERALVHQLVQDRAPRPVNLHYHSGSLFSPSCEGRSVPMHVECGLVPVDFVQENFRIVVLWQQDFELQCARFVFQATCFVRH